MTARQVHQRIALNTVTLDLKKARTKRDKLIREMHTDGWSLREIAEAAGLSHGGVKKIIDR
jgi:lambda repressor-like predicted transcriptional regulator